MITPAGDILGMTVPWLFQDLRAGKKTGTVMFTRNAEVKKVYLRSGEIIYASSNLDDDQFGGSLVRSGKITAEQRAASEEAVRKTGKQLGAVLVDRGFITPQDLVAGAKLQVKEIVCSLCLWRDGSYRFDSGPLPLAEIVPLQMNTGGLLYEGLLSVDWKVVRKSLPSLKNVLRQAKDLGFLLQGIDLDQDQQTILSFVNGERSIEEICGLSEAGDFITLKAVYALIALRLAEPIGLKTAKEGQQAAPGVAAREQAEAEPAEIIVTRELIEHAFSSLHSQNFYEMLGIGRNATAQEIKKSYFRLAKVYHPDRHANTDLIDMKPMLEMLFVSINEAYNVLVVEAKRDQYDKELARGPIKQRAEDRTAQQQDSQKGNAVTQFNEGLNRLRAQNFWGAEEAFRWAMRLDPSNHDYVFHMGLALSHMPRRRHDAEEKFKKAIQMAPSKIEYYLELGNLYAKSGLKTKALSIYQDALKRAPNSEKIKQAISSVAGGPE